MEEDGNGIRARGEEALGDLAQALLENPLFSQALGRALGAGEKAVQVVGGAGVVQQLLRAGLVDELHVDVMPVLLGEGLRLFENVDPERVKLEKKDVQDIGPRTSLEFRVLSR